MLVGVLPFFHIYGMVVIMNAALRLGATRVTMPRFDLEQFLELLQELPRDAARYLVPPIVLGARQAPDGGQVRPVERSKLIISGAAPLGATWHARLRRAARLLVHAGLRPDRDEPRHAREPADRRIKAGGDRAVRSRTPSARSSTS